MSTECPPIHRLLAAISWEEDGDRAVSTQPVQCSSRQIYVCTYVCRAPYGVKVPWNILGPAVDSVPHTTPDFWHPKMCLITNRRRQCGW